MNGEGPGVLTAVAISHYDPLCESSKVNWRKNMKTRTLTLTLALALAMMITLTTWPSMAFGQDKADKQSTGSRTVEQSKAGDNEDQDSALAGVWEEASVPATVDCQTGQPNGPIINVLLTFNQGGTMSVEDTLSIDRYRTTGGGIWKHTSERKYTYVNLHYSFDPNGNFLFTIKQRANLALSRDSNSFTEKGTFEAIDPGGNVLFGGCYTATAHRLRF